MDYYQILEVRRDCTRDQLHQAFRKLSKKFHPDRFPEQQRREAEKRYQTIVVAFNKLKDPHQREQYNKTLSSPPPKPSETSQNPKDLARKYFQTGQAKLSQSKPEEAVEAFKRAVHYHEDPEYYYHKGLAEARVKRLQKDAVGSIQKAIAKSPKNPKYYIQLAKLFVDFGMPARARTVADKASELFPANAEVRELATTMNPDKDKKSTGILGGIFGKKKGV